MATLTITVPDAQAARVFDAIAARQGYNPETDGTKAQFVKQFVIRTLKNEVAEYEADRAMAAANPWQAAVDKAHAEITLS